MAWCKWAASLYVWIIETALIEEADRLEILADFAEGLDGLHAKLKKGLQQEHADHIFYKTLILF